MISSLLAIVLEDNRDHQRAIADKLAEFGYDVKAASKAADCLKQMEAWELAPRKQRTPEPILAIIDLNLDDEDRLARTATDSFIVLRHLNQRYPSCFVIVWSANIKDRLQEVNLAHGRAVGVDKAFGLDHLVELIRRNVTFHYGDLRLDASVVTHVSSGQVWTHAVASELMMHRFHNRPLFMVDDDVKTKAVRRFRKWLERIDSTVTIKPRGQWSYELALREVVQKEKLIRKELKGEGPREEPERASSTG